MKMKAIGTIVLMMVMMIVLRVVTCKIGELAYPKG
jgi:hypothetical protein